jgi:hypothetical protein
MKMARSVVIVLSWCAFGCGGGETSTRVLVSADTGGTVTLGSEQSSLEIPPAALGGDTEVVLKRADRAKLPALDDVARMLEIEPRGTVLEGLATLTIELDAPVSDGQPVAVHQLGDQGWVDLGSIVVSGTSVEASIEAFLPVAVTVGKTDVTPGGGYRIVGTAVWGGDKSPAKELPIELWQGESKLTETKTDSEGKYSFVDLTPGDYVVVLTHMAECPAKHPVTVSADKATELDIIVCGG